MLLALLATKTYMNACMLEPRPTFLGHAQDSSIASDNVVFLQAVPTSTSTLLCSFCRAGIHDDDDDDEDEDYADAEIKYPPPPGQHNSTTGRLAGLSAFGSLYTYTLVGDVVYAVCPGQCIKISATNLESTHPLLRA
jgi:hypothetical protein